MNEASLKAILVDALDAYLGAGKTAAQVARDIATPNVGSGNADSDHRRRVRSLFGTDESGVATFLNSLVGAVGTSGTLTATTTAAGRSYSVA